MSETIKPTNTSPQHSFTSGSSSLTRPMSSSASPVWDEQHQPLSSSSFKRMPPFYVDINQTDKSYKERLASTMASNMSRGLSPAFSMSSAIEKREINLHLIMLVGLVASGKSTLAKAIVRAFGGYVLVSGEWVGSDEDSSWETEWDKCVFAAKAAFSSGMNVISDLPNETPEKRRKWIELAKEYGASIDAIVLDTSIMVCFNSKALMIFLSCRVLI
ncbi:hypothetical protein DFH27DRAFT_133388 [Peziza echinospora]|nr:hypothetical protein DFH27DRAFT_133388 [Peziza echinospora]